MIRNLTILFLLSSFVAGCGGEDGGKTLSHAEGELGCRVNNLNLPFPGGTACRGLDVSTSDLTTQAREYWYCRDSDGVEMRQYYFSNGAGRWEVIRGIVPLTDGNTGDFRGAVFNLSWSLNTETCSLWTRFDQSLCGANIEYQIADISASSITIEAADPDNLSNIESSTCQRRSTSSDSPATAERAVKAEEVSDDNPDASGSGILSLARSVLSGSFGAE